jgi:hypothetical protein
MRFGRCRRSANSTTFAAIEARTGDRLAGPETFRWLFAPARCTTAVRRFERDGGNERETFRVFFAATLRRRAANAHDRAPASDANSVVSRGIC